MALAETQTPDVDPFSDRRILVLIAADRDPELASTVRSALTQAAYPEHLRFAICHCFDESTRSQLEEWADDPRFGIDSVPFARSHGRSWARAKTVEKFDDEPYVVQIDAHTRFAVRWDVGYIDMIESIDSPAAVLTTKPPIYQIGESGSAAYELVTAPTGSEAGMPATQVLIGGHFFTRGSFCRDVAYDPNWSAEAEDVSLTDQAKKQGYQLYRPAESLVWRHGSAVEFAVPDRIEALAAATDGGGIAFDRTWDIETDHIDFTTDYQQFVFALLGADDTELFRSDIENPMVLNGTNQSVTVSAAGLDDIPDKYLLWPVQADGTFSDRRVFPIPPEAVLATAPVAPVVPAAIPPATPPLTNAAAPIAVDYSHYLIVLFNGAGEEIERRELRDPEVLAAGVDAIELTGMNRERVDRYFVASVRRDGTVGSSRLVMP